MDRYVGGLFNTGKSRFWWGHESQPFVVVFAVDIIVVQLLSWVQLFATPQTAACQASLSTIFRSLLKLMSIESVLASNHLILSSLSPLAFNLSQHPSFLMSRLFASKVFHDKKKVPYGKFSE